MLKFCVCCCCAYWLPPVSAPPIPRANAPAPVLPDTVDSPLPSAAMPVPIAFCIGLGAGRTAPRSCSRLLLGGGAPPPGLGGASDIGAPGPIPPGGTILSGAPGPFAASGRGIGIGALGEAVGAGAALAGVVNEGTPGAAGAFGAAAAAALAAGTLPHALKKPVSGPFDGVSALPSTAPPGENPPFDPATGGGSAGCVLPPSPRIDSQLLSR